MNPNENTGRWTQEEHERFLQGLEMFGKKWTKVAEVVRTRTTVQVRVGLGDVLTLPFFSHRSIVVFIRSVSVV